MNSLMIALRALMTATLEKFEAKARWTDMDSDDDNYIAARDMFRAKDDECESLVVSLIDAIKLAREGDGIAEELESLDDEALRFLRETLAGRSMMELLDESPVSFAELLNKVRRAAAAWTAAKQLNVLRQQFDAEQFEHQVQTAPANIVDKDWQTAVRALRAQLAIVRDAWGETADADDCLREAAYAAETKARVAYDKLCEVLVGEIRDMLDHGRFEAEISSLNSDARTFARDFCRRVPQPQAVPVAQTKPRWLPEVETLPQEDLDLLFGEIETFLAAN